MLAFIANYVMFLREYRLLWLIVFFFYSRLKYYSAMEAFHNEKTVTAFCHASLHMEHVISLLEETLSSPTLSEHMQK